jgi:putative sigma-54 modulation protein
MQLIVQSKNIQMTDRLHQYVEDKVNKLDRYLPVLTDARMELSTEKTRSTEDRQVAQLTVRSKGMMLRAEERSGDIFTSVDMVMDKMKRQIDRYKRKRRGVLRRAQQEEAQADMLPDMAVDEEEDEFEGGSIVRVKRFRVAPMDPEEAVEQMELLGHDFFVFFNADDGQFNVVYRRREGDYGLIQPDLD